MNECSEITNMKIQNFLYISLHLNLRMILFWNSTCCILVRYALLVCGIVWFGKKVILKTGKYLNTTYEYVKRNWNTVYTMMLQTGSFDLNHELKSWFK